MEEKNAMESCAEYVVRQRRVFHRIPEVSLKEAQTSREICAELKRLGVPFEVVGDYGVVAHVEGRSGGCKIALRADIDALPMQEETGLSFSSQNDCAMHSCGHDGHIAILLATAKCLSEQRDAFSGTVFLCFQQAEEIGTGQEPVLAYLRQQGEIELVLSTHLWADIPVGKISVEAGAIMAGTTGFRVKVVGCGCHGSRPDQGIDPINAAVSLIGDVMRLKDREISPLCSNTLSFGLFHSGTATNIIPSEAELGGTIRFFSEDERKHLISLLERACVATQTLTGCQVDFQVGVGLPPVVNHSQCVEAACQSAARVFGKENLIQFGKIMASDNFGCYLQEFKGLYAFIGIKNEQKGACYAHHNCKFDLDEDALELATGYNLDFILHHMGGTEQ